MPVSENTNDGGTAAVVADGNPETRAAAITDALHAVPQPGDREGLRTHLHALADAGVKVVFLNPGTKLPKADLRTPAHRAADDRALQEEAREAGLIGWEMRRATKGGVYLATADHARLDDYLDEYAKRFGKGKVVNIGVGLGPSGLIMVDTDTPEQEAAIRQMTQDEPVVLTPGTRDAKGEGWAHHGGGHRYYTVPVDKWLPEKGEQELDGGVVAYWGQTKQAVLPPSVRPEGAYVVTEGAVVQPAPDWLLKAILKPNRNTKQNRGTGGSPYVSDPDDPITAWGETTTWREILDDAPGWMATGKADGCGCEIWTAPGLHASTKSATAHEHGCRLTDSTDPVLHLWTDHSCEPFDGYTNMTRLRAVALIHYGGDIAEAMSRLGIEAATPDLSLSLEAIGMPTTSSTAAAAPLNGAVYGDTNNAHHGDVADDAMADLRAAMAANTELFDDSPILRHIRSFADSRGAERFGSLVGVCLHAVAAVPPCVVLPPIVRGPGSLNLFLAAVGVPGGGKGAIDDTGRLAVRFTVRGTDIPNLDMLKLGTGEGINRTYATARQDRLTRVSVVRQHADRALFGSPDIDTWAALQARKGATLVPELLGAFMGEPLGFANAGAESRVMLPSHSYRLCLSVGVQPENGSILLDGHASGTPQRFLWFPVRPGVARRRRQEDDPVVPTLTVDLPDFGVYPIGTLSTSGDPFTVAENDDGGIVQAPHVVLDVDWSIAQRIIDADAAKDLDPLGRTPGDPMAGHRLFMQEKLAAVIGFLHGEARVTEENWQRAERVLAVSSAMTTASLALADASAGREAVRQGELHGVRQVAADTVRDGAKVRDVAARLYARVGADWDTVNASAFITKSKHELIESAWLLLIPGQVEARDYLAPGGKPTRQYRRVS